MKTYFQESVKIVSSKLIFIFILALLGSYIPSEATRWFTGITVIISLIIIPVVYGRFIGIVTGEQYLSFVQILKRHWLNLFIARLIISMPAGIFLLLFKGMVIQLAVWGAVNVLTIYVWPLVFLRRNPFIAVRLGVKSLLANFKYSLPLVLLAFLATAISKSLNVTLVSRDYSFTLATLNFVRNCLWWFIEFTVFTTASMILVKESSLFKRAV